MSERETSDTHSQASDTNRKGIVSIAVAIVLIALLIIVVWAWWGSEDDDSAQRQPAPVEVREPEPEQPPPQPEPVVDDFEEPEPESEPPVIEEPEIEQAPEIELPDLNDSTSVVMDDAESRELSTRPLRSEHLVRDLVIFVHNLSSGDVIRDSAAVRGPDARFATQTVDEQLYIDERSYARYNEMVDWFTALDSERLVSVYSDYEPLFREAFAEIAQPDEQFIDQVMNAIDVLLATPEPEGLLALSDDQVMYTFADPELEQLPAAQKQMLRLGLQNQRRVKRKLRELRALLEERR